MWNCFRIPLSFYLNVLWFNHVSISDFSWVNFLLLGLEILNLFLPNRSIIAITFVRLLMRQIQIGSTFPWGLQISISIWSLLHILVIILFQSNLNSSDGWIFDIGCLPSMMLLKSWCILEILTMVVTFRWPDNILYLSFVLLFTSHLISSIKFKLFMLINID